MEWLVGIAAVVAVLWWFGRHRGPCRSVAAAAPVAGVDEVIRRAVDPNDSDGAFMDGYVSGRLTERSRERDDTLEPAGPWHHPPRDPLSDEEDDLYGFEGYADPGPDDW